jgi:GntR family transcriptional regulator, carbon starvation induced regulator
LSRSATLRNRDAEFGSLQGVTGKTRASVVFDRLHDDLLNCEFAPGEKLLFRVLMKRYDTGISTIREALLRLVGTGLVQMEEQRGFYATPATRADLLELAKLRQQVETLALRNSIENATDDSNGEILKCYYRLSKLLRAAEPKSGKGLDTAFAKELEARHSDFHEALVARCDMPRLLHFRKSLFEQSNRYRRLKDVRHRIGKKTDTSHRVLMEAVLERNVEGACRLMNDHVMHTAELLLSDPSLKKILGPTKSR